MPRQTVCRDNSNAIYNVMQYVVDNADIDRSTATILGQERVGIFVAG